MQPNLLWGQMGNFCKKWLEYSQMLCPVTACTYKFGDDWSRIANLRTIELPRNAMGIVL